MVLAIPAALLRVVVLRMPWRYSIDGKAVAPRKMTSLGVTAVNL